MATAVALVRAMRPRQWVKNVLVLAAPFAAGRLSEWEIAGPTLLAFVSFVCASSAVYLLNDVRDVDQDRLHPTKRRRPVAAGDLSPTLAVVAGVVLIVAALAIAALASMAMLATIGVYLLLQVAYVYWLKFQPVLDLAIVASGFLLRALAGGAATGLPISDWFLLAAGFGSLFMVAGKRYSELVTADSETVGSTRATLTEYTPAYLRFVWTIAAATTVIVYALWITSVSQPREGLALATLVPFTLALLVYARDVDLGVAGEPEDVVLGNRTLQVLAVVWAAMLAASLYA